MEKPAQRTYELLYSAESTRDANRIEDEALELSPRRFARVPVVALPHRKLSMLPRYPRTRGRTQFPEPQYGNWIG